MQRDALLLGEMIDVAEEAIAIASENDRTSLAADRRQHDALLWNFTVLGEASAQISREIKASNPDVPWARPVQLRNRIIHGYWSVDLGVLHTTALEQLPAFVRTAPPHLADSAGPWGMIPSVTESPLVLERPVHGVAEAAGLLGLRPDRTRAWLNGYERSGVGLPAAFVGPIGEQ